MNTKVFAFGSNGSGQLGIGHTDDVDSPTECQFALNELRAGESITQIAAGGNHTLLLTSAGRVFASGSNEGGRSGLPVDIYSCSNFQLVDLSKKAVTHIAATWEASIFAVGGRWIYACGSGPKGELGAGTDEVALSEPRLIIDLEDLQPGSRIAQLCAGMSHVVLMTTDYDLFGWGSCRKGQLGDDMSKARVAWTPRKVRHALDVRGIAVGRDFTAVGSAIGGIHMLGDQRQLADSIQNFSIGPSNRLLCGWSTIYAQDAGDVVGFGRNKHAQLPPHDLPTLKLFAVGSEHCLATTQDAQLIAWGWGEHGNCGPRPVAEPGSLVSWNVIDADSAVGKQIYFVGAGCATSFVAVRI